MKANNGNDEKERAGNETRSAEGPYDPDQEELERLLLEGVGESSDESRPPGQRVVLPQSTHANTRLYHNEDSEVPAGGDLQGALGLYAEAAQDMVTAGGELALGRDFACADCCNQAAEEAAPSVSLLRLGRQSTYNHDLRALGALVGATEESQEEMDISTPFHPETFYADTPPDDTDQATSAEQAISYA